MKKRIGSLLLAMMMVVSGFTLPVYAAEPVNAIKTIEIDDMRAPRAGESPDYDITIADSRYETVDPGIYREDLQQCNNGVVWFRVDKTSGAEVEKILVPTDTFELGKKYRARVFVKPTTGNAYAETVTAGVKEQESLEYTDAVVMTPSGYGNTDYKVVAYTHECTISAIDTVEITGLDLPEAGASPDFECNVETENVIINGGVEWRDGNGNTMEAEEDTFVAGETYKLIVWLRSDFQKGYFFKMHGDDNVVQVLINGIPFEKTESPHTSYTAEIEYEFYVPHKEIKEIRVVGVDSPAAGMLPDYEAVPATAGYDITSVQWWDVTSSPSHEMESGETFVGGHQYRVTIDVTAQDNYKIYYDPSDEYKEYEFTATVNGKAAQKTSSCEGEPAYFQYDFEPIPLEVVEKIDVTGIDTPVAGNVPDYDGVLNTEGVKIVKIIWHDYTDNKNLTNGDKQTFVAGHVYGVIVATEIEDGYKYKNDLDIVTADGYINGLLATPGSSGAGAKQFDISITFDTIPYKSADKIVVSGFDVPAAGAVIDLTGVVSGSGIQFKQAAWYDVTGGKALTAGGKFEAGHSYKLLITVTTDQNYIFPLNAQMRPDSTKITATINGAAAQFESSGSGKEATIFCTYQISGVCDHKAGTPNVTVKATASKAGTKVSSCTVCGTALTQTTIKPAKVTLSKTAYTYNGKVISSKNLPKVSVKTGDGKAIAAKYYTVSKPKNEKKMKAIGRYTYTVKFKSTCPEYTGTVKLHMEIKPVKVTQKVPKAAKKAITVKWKKGKKAQVTGYEVMVATNSKFTKNKKTATVKGYSKVSKKMTGLKAKTKYYVRVRTYKTVKGVKIYSDWSKMKSCKTK